MIDAHVHFLPPEIAADLAALAGREPYWGLLLDPPQRKSIQGYAGVERMLADMDAAGVERVVIVGEYFQQHASCVARNNRVIDLVRRFPDRMTGMIAVQPLAGQAAIDELDRCRQAGLIGVGELNPYAQGFRLDGAEFMAVAGWCAGAGVPLNLHANEEVGPFYPGKSATPLRHYYDLAGRLPELKLILAHWGGGLLFYELMAGVRAQLTNVSYDTAASPLQYSTSRIFPLALQCVGPQKILFGSDYPLRLFPARQKEADMRPFLAEIDGLEMSAVTRRALLHENAARLFGLLPQPATIAAAAGETPDDVRVRLTPLLPLVLLVEEWPAAGDVLRRHGIAWVDEPHPSWEPLAQAAAARGYTPVQQQALFEEIIEAIEDDKDATS